MSCAICFFVEKWSCGQPSSLSCNMVQNKLRTLPLVRNLWTTAGGSPSHPPVRQDVLQILWKAWYEGESLEAGASTRGTPFLNLNRGHSREVSTGFQSKTVAVFPSLCFKKITVLVISPKHPAQHPTPKN